MNNEKIEEYGSQNFFKDGIKFCTTRGRNYNGCFRVFTKPLSLLIGNYLKKYANADDPWISKLEN